MSEERIIRKRSVLNHIGRFVINNSVTVLFTIVCLIGIIASKEQPFMLVSLLLERMTRNTFLVLALLIPVVAGMGLNFSITIGAMAAQVAIIVVAYLKISSGYGLALAFLLSAPLALILGKLIGKLLNRARGQEMIASMITGFFADGVYQLIFLFFVGTLIPMTGNFIIPGGVGLRNTIDLKVDNGIAKALDNVISIPFFTFLIITGIVIFFYYLGKTVTRKKVISEEKNPKFLLYLLFAVNILIAGALIYFLKFDNEIIKRNTLDIVDLILIVSYFTVGLNAWLLGTKAEKYEINGSSNIKEIFFGSAGLALLIYSLIITYGSNLSHSMKMLKTVKMSLFTAVVVILFAGFNVIILKTKLGQTFKTVGQDQHIAEIAGIKVNKIRELAIMLSTMFAAWGQIIFIQNLGILNTYGSHKQIALFAVAALLIGGASVSKATVGQAFLGVLLFHTLFIVSPKAGLNLFGDAQIGEYFRTFVAYGVIGVSLGLHAWKTMAMKRSDEKI